VNKSHRVRPFVTLSIVFALAFLLLWGDLARADAVDDVLASQFNWRQAHPVSKARMRVIAGGGAPVGWYYLDLRSTTPTEVSIMSLLLGKSELIMRTVTDGNVGHFFFNEDVYLELSSADLSVLGGSGFWAAQDVAEARAALSGIYDIRGVTTKTVKGTTYDGITMLLNDDRWEVFSATVGPELMANMVPNFTPEMTIYFAPSGELHSLALQGPEINIEVLFHDWTDMTGAKLAELDDVRRPPHSKQKSWDLPLDEALIKYITMLTQ
jgi:hypothetical protein